MSKHTAGPWRTVRRSATVAIENADGDILAEVYGKTTRPEKEWYANAELIAAAPDLLEACKTIIKLGKSRYHDLGIDKMVEAAVDKAEKGG